VQHFTLSKVAEADSSSSSILLGLYTH